MVQADKRVMQALLTPQGQVIVQFLEKCLADKDRDCRQAEGITATRAQGAALELQEIIDLAKNARDAL